MSEVITLSGGGSRRDISSSRLSRLPGRWDEAGVHAQACGLMRGGPMRSSPCLLAARLAGLANDVKSVEASCGWWSQTLTLTCRAACLLAHPPACPRATCVCCVGVVLVLLCVGVGCVCDCVSRTGKVAFARRLWLVVCYSYAVKLGWAGLLVRGWAGLLGRGSPPCHVHRV